jgi:RNA polymerase-interacting CarD/CdnL/TRCF family regulator
MDFQVGDHVIHKNHGMGRIVQLEEKVLTGRATRCYVVQFQDLTVWVPVQESGESNLRLPTPRSEFENIFSILRAPGESLSNNRFERKTQLMEKMQDGKIESICRVVRDLSFYRSDKKLNEHDVLILERAQNFLLSEWKLVFSVSMSEAKQKLTQMLNDNNRIKSS